MRRFGYISTAVLGSLLGIAVSVSAQQQEDREKPATPPAATRENQVTPPEQVNPAEEKRQQEAKPGQQQEEKRTQQTDKNEKKMQQEQKQEQKDNKQTQDEQKREQKTDQRVQKQKEDRNNPQAKPAQDTHRTGGNTGSRIPDDKFRSHFGREHHFRVSRPVVVSGQPRFAYGGYTFIFVDPWPVGWDYADDCYIDYVDGEYLLFDLAHPGVSIVVNVEL